MAQSTERWPMGTDLKSILDNVDYYLPKDRKFRNSDDWNSSMNKLDGEIGIGYNIFAEIQKQMYDGHGNRPQLIGNVFNSTENILKLMDSMTVTNTNIRSAYSEVVASSVPARMRVLRRVQMPILGYLEVLGKDTLDVAKSTDCLKALQILRKPLREFEVTVDAILRDPSDKDEIWTLSKLLKELSEADKLSARLYSAWDLVGKDMQRMEGYDFDPAQTKSFNQSAWSWPNMDKYYGKNVNMMTASIILNRYNNGIYALSVLELALKAVRSAMQTLKAGIEKLRLTERSLQASLMTGDPWTAYNDYQDWKGAFLDLLHFLDTESRKDLDSIRTNILLTRNPTYLTYESRDVRKGSSEPEKRNPLLPNTSLLLAAGFSELDFYSWTGLEYVQAKLELSTNRLPDVLLTGAYARFDKIRTCAIALPAEEVRTIERGSFDQSRANWTKYMNTSYRGASHRINFSRPFTEPPSVIAWFTHIVTPNKRGANWDDRFNSAGFTISKIVVDSKGFDIEIQVSDNFNAGMEFTFLYDISWLALDKTRKGRSMYATMIQVEKVTRGNVSVLFPKGLFKTPPTIFTGLAGHVWSTLREPYIKVDTTTNINGVVVEVKTMKGPLLDRAKVAILAVDEIYR